MNILVLGKGKTGALVAECARELGHQVTSAGRPENEQGRAITPSALSPFNVVIDFTTPAAALANIEACARAGKKMVVGTTGWYEHMPHVRQLVADSRTSLVWGGNFSVGVNLFYDIARAAALASKYGYTFQITETHHVHKKDAPSGTAVVLQKILRQSAGETASIESIRAGDNMGRHEITLTSAVDTITLIHQAHSRRGFALGAVRAAEWLATAPPGIYDFSEIFHELG
jgi:4-hydroxy-tetrahydrodipicolinate reductase